MLLQVACSLGGKCCYTMVVSQTYRTHSLCCRGFYIFSRPYRANLFSWNLSRLYVGDAAGRQMSWSVTRIKIRCPFVQHLCLVSLEHGALSLWILHISEYLMWIEMWWKNLENIIWDGWLCSNWMWQLYRHCMVLQHPFAVAWVYCV